MLSGQMPCLSLAPNYQTSTAAHIAIPQSSSLFLKHISLMDLSTVRLGNDVKGLNVENLKVPFMKDCLNKLPHLTKITTKSL